MHKVHQLVSYPRQFKQLFNTLTLTRTADVSHLDVPLDGVYHRWLTLWCHIGQTVLPNM